MDRFTMTIDGKAVAGERTLGVINPATGKVFAQCPDATRAQLDAALDAAQRAFPAWNRDEARRRDVLRACSAALRAQLNDLARLLVQEQGKPLAKASEEIVGSFVWFDVTAGLPIPVEVVQDDARARVEIRRRPHGVVGAITPWNFPLLLAVWKIAPALLAGNTLVLKPSPFTPLTSLRLGEILREVVPAGVLNVVSGGDELGAWLTSHPVPRKISFTGSIATGKKIAAATAPDLKRLTLELGGNDPAIVLGDVDPKQVAAKLFRGAFENCGQTCAAVKRVYAHESIYATLVEELAGLARATKVGDGLDPATQFGPLNNAPQLARVEELVEDARRAGGRIVAGGARLAGEGYFYAPTIVSDVADGTRLVDEEQFGPALPILPFRDVEDALERANATHFGLGASVWTADAERGAQLAGRLEAGTAWVNQHVAILPNLPFGGHKWSGIGVENGPWGLLAYTDIQVVNVAKALA